MCVWQVETVFVQGRNGWGMACCSSDGGGVVTSEGGRIGKIIVAVQLLLPAGMYVFPSVPAAFLCACVMCVSCCTPIRADHLSTFDRLRRHCRCTLGDGGWSFLGTHIKIYRVCADRVPQRVEEGKLGAASTTYYYYYYYRYYTRMVERNPYGRPSAVVSAAVALGAPYRRRERKYHTCFGRTIPYKHIAARPRTVHGRDFSVSPAETCI